MTAQLLNSCWCLKRPNKPWQTGDKTDQEIETDQSVSPLRLLPPAKPKVDSRFMSNMLVLKRKLTPRSDDV